MNNEEKILALLEQMDARQNRTEAILETIQGDVSGLKEGQAATNARLEKLEAGQADLKQDVRRLNQSVAVIESKVNHDFNIIIEGITDLNERNRQIDKLDDKVDSHDHRIWALEQVVKK